MKRSVMIDKAFFLGLALLGSAQAAGRTYDFVTPSYGINIVANCAEGNVTCNNVTYVGRHLKTGQTIRLRGQTVHTLCADKVTPCRFVGYSFRNREYPRPPSPSYATTVGKAARVGLSHATRWPTAPRMVGIKKRV